VVPTAFSTAPSALPLPAPLRRPRCATHQLSCGLRYREDFGAEEAPERTFISGLQSRLRKCNFPPPSQVSGVFPAEQFILQKAFLLLDCRTSSGRFSSLSAIPLLDACLYSRSDSDEVGPKVRTPPCERNEGIEGCRRGHE